MNLGRYEGLLAQARREIRMMPPISFWLGPHPSRAIEELDPRIALHPRDPAGYRSRGALYARANKPDRAIQDFSRALKLEPDNGFVYCSRGSQYAKLHALDRALADYDRAIALKTDPVSAYSGRANLDARRGQLDQALADYNRALDYDPGQTDGYRNRGMIYLRQGDWRRALADFQQMVVTAPLEPVGYHLMAHTLAAANKLETAYSLKPSPPHSLADALSELAWVLATHPDAKYRNGDQALRYAEEAIASQAAPTAWRFNVLAAAYAEVGNFPKSVEAAERGIDLATADGNHVLAEELGARLRLYRAHRPYHLSPPAR